MNFKEIWGLADSWIDFPVTNTSIDPSRKIYLQFSIVDNFKRVI